MLQFCFLASGYWMRLFQAYYSFVTVWSCPSKMILELKSRNIVSSLCGFCLAFFLNLYRYEHMNVLSNSTAAAAANFILTIAANNKWRFIYIFITKADHLTSVINSRRFCNRFSRFWSRIWSWSYSVQWANLLYCGQTFCRLFYLEQCQNFV